MTALIPFDGTPRPDPNAFWQGPDLLPPLTFSASGPGERTVVPPRKALGTRDRKSSPDSPGGVANQIQGKAGLALKGPGSNEPRKPSKPFTPATGGTTAPTPGGGRSSRTATAEAFMIPQGHWAADHSYTMPTGAQQINRISEFIAPT